MKYGCFYDQLVQGGEKEGLSRREAYQKAQEAGIVALDVNSDFLLEGPESFLAEAQEFGLCIASVHGYMYTEFRTEVEWEASAKKMEAAMDLAVRAKSPFFMPVPQPTEDFDETADHQAWKAAVRKWFARWAEYGKKIGIQTTIENYSEGRHTYSSFDDIAEILENSPDLMYTFDSGNFPLAGYDEVEGARRFLDRTVYVHLKDLVKVDFPTCILRDGIYYDSVALGQGYLGNEEALRMLWNRGYDGYVMIEVCADAGVFQRVMDSAAYLKGLC